MSMAISPPADRSTAAGKYVLVLSWLFAVFNSVRVLAYLPTLWAIHVSGDSSQHSLWTWLTWLGANATMAAWLYETGGRQFSRTSIVSACNAFMCLLTAALIVWYRN